MSMFKTMCIELAHYNRWQNERLFACCESLTDEELKLDRGMFFNSLFATLNHIYHVDCELLDYIDRGTPPENFDPEVQRFADFEGLKQARSAVDDQVIAKMQSSPDEWFEEIFEFFSDDRGTIRRRPRGLFIVQMFNHQTHHRSQATSMLHLMGMDYGTTDLPANPYSQS